MWKLLCLVICSSALRIPLNDPLYNQTIIRVLSAYLNIGIVFSPTKEEFVYDDKSFAQVFKEFLPKYLQINSSAAAPSRRHIQMIELLKAKVAHTDENTSP